MSDVLVIGAGPGGAACAWTLARRGLDVHILEAGPRYDPVADYRLHKEDWEVTRFPYKEGSQGRYTWGAEQPLDDQRWGHLRSWSRVHGHFNPGNTRRYGAYHHVRGVGGSTLHFTGEAHRLHPAAMALKTRFGVGADWPFGYAELEPHYCTAETLIGVAGPRDNPLRWRSRPYPLPPHEPSYASQRLRASGPDLGLHWEANPLAALSRPYRDNPACNFCGGCNRGCPRGDKGSADITFIPAAVATGRCTVSPGTQVLRLEAGPGDRVTGVVCRSPDGVTQRLSAPIIVLAGGAVETPRLLLASQDPVHAPDGLANDSGQVGHNFLETLSFAASGLHPEPLGSNRGLPTDSICWDFNAPDAIDGTIGGCRFTPAAHEADLAGPISYATRVLEGWGTAHKQAMRAQFGQVLAVGAIGESLPDAGSFVDLDPTAVDAHGVPLARIHSRIAESELTRLDFMARYCRDILFASGVERIFEEYGTYDTFSATHVFGTCRMGTDPQTSVVDGNGRSHRWQNLYIADASVFPSSGGGESPMLTIAALAIRTGEAIAKSG